VPVRRFHAHVGHRPRRGQSFLCARRYLAIAVGREVTMPRTLKTASVIVVAEITLFARKTVSFPELARRVGYLKRERERFPKKLRELVLVFCPVNGRVRSYFPAELGNYRESFRLANFRLLLDGDLRKILAVLRQNGSRCCTIPKTASPQRASCSGLRTVDDPMIAVNR